MPKKNANADGAMASEPAPTAGKNGTDNVKIEPNGSETATEPFAPGLRQPLETVKLRVHEYKILNDRFEFAAAPGHMENVHVGSLDWMKAWFPAKGASSYIAVQFGTDEEATVFLPEDVLLANFDYFVIAMSIGGGNFVEGTTRKVTLQEDEKAAFGILISFLCSGTFPTHPKTEIQKPAERIDAFIAAARLGDYLQMKCFARFLFTMEVELRKLLYFDRTALTSEHIRMIYVWSDTHVDTFYQIRLIVASAAVKPWMQSWMAVAPVATVQVSMAFAPCEVTSVAWVRTVKHYVKMVNEHLLYSNDVMRLAHATMRDAKRFNRCTIADKSRHGFQHMPVEVDTTTYKDPLPLGKARLFTI